MQQLPDEDACAGPTVPRPGAPDCALSPSRHERPQQSSPVPTECRHAMREAVYARPASGSLASNRWPAHSGGLSNRRIDIDMTHERDKPRLAPGLDRRQRCRGPGARGLRSPRMPRRVNG